MDYQVPQFIEVEDKLVGPLTFKQFVYLAGGAGICVILFVFLPAELMAHTSLLSVAFNFRDHNCFGRIERGLDILKRKRAQRMLVSGVDPSVRVGELERNELGLVGFLGLDVLLVYLAFRLNFSAAKAYEEVTVTPSELRVRKVSHLGRAREWVLNPLWVKLDRVVHAEFGVERDAPVLWYQFFADSLGGDLLSKVTSSQESHGAPPGTYLAVFSGTAWPLAPFLLLALPFAMFFVLLLVVEALSFRYARDEDDLIGYDFEDTRTSLMMGVGHLVIYSGWKLVMAAALLIATPVSMKVGDHHRTGNAVPAASPAGPEPMTATRRSASHAAIASAKALPSEKQRRTLGWFGDRKSVV